MKNIENTNPIINILLEVAIKEFPNTISIHTNFSNNPHGNWLLSVFNSNGLIDEFYYESEADRNLDATTLEDLFNL